MCEFFFKEQKTKRKVIEIFGEALKSKINKLLECHDYVLWP